MGKEQCLVMSTLAWNKARVAKGTWLPPDLSFLPIFFLVHALREAQL